MGTNRRYADAAERRRFNREAEARALVARSLSDAERGSETIRRGTPVPVKAWVDYGNASTEVLAVAIAWTSRCVRVMWTDSHEQKQEASVWVGAVTRL